MSHVVYRYVLDSILLQYFIYESSVNIRNGVFVRFRMFFRFNNRISDCYGLVV